MKKIKDQKKHTPPQLVIITGLSGAGMSSVLKTLEDINFEAFDNFPLALISPLLKDNRHNPQPIAVGVDSRTRGFKATAVLKIAEDQNARLLFITCDDHVLQKRFTETRRRHPLAKDRPVIDGIRRERRLLWDLQTQADIVIDTSEMSVHDLRHTLEGHFGTQTKGRMTIALKSFGFKYGVPREADIVMDVRFLQNPNWIKNLKPKTGLDKKVGAYVESDSAFKPFLKNFKAMIKPLLPRYAVEGKSYLTIAIGCTGGRHRSVHTLQLLDSWLKSMGHTTHTEHRDIGR
jgi:UPF0042 nucleotide-binding protein